ncbi:MAG: porin family protein [Rhizobiaceae bacterium]|nr:porin family protein [Rhizobiaceae bacterium]
MRIAFAGLVLVLAQGAASAADLELASPDIDPARFAWDGVYIGATGGYAWLHDIDYQFPVPFRDQGRDWVYGAYVGYLHDFGGGFVAGGELEALKLDITYDNFAFITVEDAYTLKARAGYGWDRLLVSAHLGGTWATTNIGLEDWGIALGAGVDYALTDYVTVGAQYSHHSFRRFDGTLIDATLDIATARVGLKF